MDLKRFFIDEPINNNKEVRLCGKEFYHAVKVTRHKIGYKLIICDNSGYDFYCTVSAITADFLLAIVDEKKYNESEIKSILNLYIGINKDFDVSVQKAVEMGVKNIYPMLTQHGNIKNINEERINKIILESSKQCGRAILPILKPVISYDLVIKSVAANAFLFYEHENIRRIECANSNSNSIIDIIIGSEGGFSEDEILKAKNEGIKTYTLGKRILRVNTALVSALALVIEGLQL